MVVTVSRPYIDKYTNVFHKEGELLHISAERCAELAPLGFVVPEKTAEKEEKPKGRKRAAKTV